MALYYGCASCTWDNRPVDFAFGNVAAEESADWLRQPGRCFIQTGMVFFNKLSRILMYTQTYCLPYEPCCLLDGESRLALDHVKQQ